MTDSITVEFQELSPVSLQVTPATTNVLSLSSAGFAQTTDEVSEGTNNLYFTPERASSAAPVQSVAGRTGTVTLSTTDISGLGTAATQASSSFEAAGAAATAQAYAVQRGNHTGAQAISTITGLQTALDGKQAAGSYATAAQGAKADTALQPGAAISTISGLQTALDGKQAAGSYAPATGIAPSAIAGTAVITTDSRLSDSRTPTAHTHAISQVTGLQAALDGKQIAGSYATAAQGAKADTALQPGTAISNVTGLQTALDGKQPSGTYATLVGGTVPASQLPSYVDDVLEFATLSAFPATGETGKIYVATGSNKTYRWSGSSYVEIASSPGSTDAVTEGSTNLYFTAARAVSALASTLSSYATQAWVTAQGFATTSSVTTAISALVTGVSSVAGKTGAVSLVKGDVGLGDVDNTSDANKPISTAVQTALDGKQAAGSYAPALGIDPSAITGTAVITTDSRLSDSRTPTAHTHVVADITGLQAALDDATAGASLFELNANGDIQPIA
jgi:hypothetical protein